jgi:hypothetical protein
MLKRFMILLLSSSTIFAQIGLAQATAAPKTATAPKTQSSPAPASAAKQGQPPAQANQSPKPGQTADQSAQVPPTEDVVTIHGICSGSASGAKKTSAPAAGCVTKMTRAQFDKLVQSINPSGQAVPPNVRRNLAQRYVELLAFADAAEKAGVDKDPRLAERLRVQRLATLAELYRQSLEEKYKNPPQSEIDAYYNQHKGDFEQAKLRRIYIPKNDLSGKSTTPEQKSAFQTKAEQLANGIRDRAAKGEDTDKLQKEVYSTLGLPGNPPNTEIGAIRKGSLKPDDEKQIFALNPGGIYKSDEPSAVVIYKLEGKETLGLDAAKAEISQLLFRRKMEEKLKEITGSVKVVYDEKFFGPPTPAGPPRPPGDQR